METVISFEQIQSRIWEWADGFLAGKEIATSKANLSKHWYYSDVYDTFGPSKFVGYVGFTLAQYNDMAIDGITTQAAIKALKVYREVAPDEAGYDELRAKLQAFLRIHGNKPRRGCKIHVPTRFDLSTLGHRSVWWVNQGESMEQQRELGLIWAPLINQAGVELAHWSRIQNVKPGDLFIHYSKKHVRAIGLVIAPPEMSKWPYEDDGRWGEEGRLVKIEYWDLSTPVILDDFADGVKDLPFSDGPFNVEGRIKQGNLFDFSWEGLSAIEEASNEEWPRWAAENLHDTGDDNPYKELSRKLILLGLDMKTSAAIWNEVKNLGKGILNPIQLGVLKGYAHKIVGVGEWDAELLRRKKESDRFKEVVHRSGVLEGKTIDRQLLAEMVDVVWQIQNLNGIEVSKFLGTYAHHVYFKKYKGTSEEFTAEFVAKRPDLATYEPGINPGVDIEKFSADLKALLSAQNETESAFALSECMAHAHAGRGLITGMANLFAPEKYPLINGAAVGPFEKGGVVQIDNAQRKVARAVALNSASLEVKDIPKKGVRATLGWIALISEVADTLNVGDYLAVDRLFWQIVSSQELITRAWIFQSSPKRYNLEGALGELDELYWQVNQHKDEIKVGDIVFLWEAGGNAGIWAKATVVTLPAPMAVTDEPPVDGKWVRDSSLTKYGDGDYSLLKIEHKPETRVSRDKIRETPGLSDLSILKVAQGTNFPVTPAQADSISQLLHSGTTPPPPPPVTRYWKVAPEEKGRLWSWWLDEGIASIGWGELGDLSELSREEFNEKKTELYPGRLGPSQVWTFSQIEVGDIIIANKGQKKILGVGVVVRPYYFESSGPDDHFHRLGVAWDDQLTVGVNEKSWLRTLLELAPDRARKLIGDWTPPDVVPPPPIRKPHPEYSIEQLAAETGFNEDELTSWVRAIERKGQAVLYGPPGTGKTFVAERLARHLIGGGTGVSDLVQFHPSYAYEDFIQGIRPETSDDGSLTYDLVPGRFRDFCDAAATREGSSVLIIDEINRANLSRVFGELMYLLEYRGNAVPLAGGEQLKIPKSVRIIGTMNTADRSIALVDHALRRRFAFLRLPPNYEVLEKYHEKTGFDVAGLVETLREVNKRIGDRNYEMGISFFLREDIEEHIEDIWRMEIEPYLEEFFFDSPKKVDELRWDRVGKNIKK